MTDEATSLRFAEELDGIRRLIYKYLFGEEDVCALAGTVFGVRSQTESRQLYLTNEDICATGVLANYAHKQKDVFIFFRGASNERTT